MTITEEGERKKAIQKIYDFFGAADHLRYVRFDFGHNYNQVSREFMYGWFNQHLVGGSGDVKEQAFKPIAPKDLSVYDAEHPRPAALRSSIRPGFRRFPDPA